jgi:Fic family protein
MIERMNKRLISLDGETASKIYQKIAAIDEFKGWFKAGLALSPHVLGRLKRSVVVSSTGASTRIEGSKLTDPEIEALLKGLKVSALKDRDSQEVAGYAELTNMVFDSYEHMKITENEIRNLHKILLKYSGKDERHKGSYKNTANKVTASDAAGKVSVVFEPTEPYLVPGEMRGLTEWVHNASKESSFHPLLITANFILEFLSIHPFEDGNGRLSRVLTNLMMLKSGYRYAQYVSLEKIVEDNKGAYYVALRKSQQHRNTGKGDIRPWLCFFFDMLTKQVEAVQKIAGESAGADLLSENQVKVLGMFDSRERITNRCVAETLGTNRNTAKQVLNRLVELKMIKRIGAGRSTGYVKKNE